MKTNRNVLKAVAAAVLSATSGFAAAADSQAITVTATVSPVCRFVNVPNISFTINPSLTGAQTGTSNVQYRCTNGTAPTIGATGGLTGRTLTGSGTTPPTLAYDLLVGAALAGNGFSGTARTLVVTASVADTAYRDAVADTYSENVTLTVSP